MIRTPQHPPEVEPGSIAEELLRVLLRSVKRALAGNVEAIHDVRVSSRRLQEWLRVVEPWIGRRTVKRLSRELKAIRKSFQETRDLDVLLDSLAEQGTGQMPTSHRRALVRELKSARAGGLKTAQSEVDGAGVAKTTKLTQGVVDRVRIACGAEAFKVEAARLTRQRLAAVIEFTRSSSWTDDIHQLRLHAKRLRYARELMRPGRQKKTDGMLKALAAVQEQLGQWNDHVTAARAVGRLATRKKFLSQHSEVARSWLDYAAARAASADSVGKVLIREWPQVRDVILEIIDEADPA